MALAIVEETLRAGGDAVVVVPASVRSMWRRMLQSLGDVGSGCRVVTHAALSRGRVPTTGVLDAPGGGSGARTANRIVVVDEAHRFRNPKTMRYAALARLLEPRPDGTRPRALLLTATPINNRAEDLLHLIRLFARDDAFRDAGVPSVRDAFGVDTSGADAIGADESRGGASAAQTARDRLAAVVRSVMVRRTRGMVSARFGEPESSLRFPRRALPRLVRYDDAALPSTVAELASLDLAVYALSDDGSAGDSRAEPAGLLIINLLKRLDSSPAAFDASVVRLRELTRTSLEAAMAGRIMTPARQPGRGSSDGDPLQLALVELVARGATPDTDMPRLIESLRDDLQTLTRLRPGDGRDPKLCALRTLLHELGGERVIVFTEYRDTAAYLERSLVRRFRIGRVDGSGAWLGGRPAGRRRVVEAFAPGAHGRDALPERERVDLLIATDVLSEGVNLQDARHLISYDLPWNPVRLLQRIGRVDRLGSPHAEVASYLFVPSTGLEAMLGLRRRLRQKLGHITTIVGGEEADELLTGIARADRVGTQARETIPAGAMERIDARESDDAIDAMESLRTLWIRERGGSTAPPPPASPPPDTSTAATPKAAAVCVDADDSAATLAWLVLVLDAAGTVLLEVDQEDTIRSAGPRSVAAFRQALRPAGGCAHRRCMVSGAVPAPPLEALRSHRASVIAALEAPRPLSAHEPAAALARRLRRSAAAAGVALDRRFLDRIDRALDRLVAPLDPVSEDQVRTILDDEGRDLEDLLDVTEDVLCNAPRSARNAASGSAAQPPDLRVLAALHIRVNSDLAGG